MQLERVAPERLISKSVEPKSLFAFRQHLLRVVAYSFVIADNVWSVRGLSADREDLDEAEQPESEPEAGARC